MKLVIPMAGAGKRLQPLTFTTPKPLVKIAGKPIVQWLIESIANSVNEKITDIAYVIGNFPPAVITSLKLIAKEAGANAHFYTQSSPLGTAHAIYCAKDLLNGRVVVAFADTIVFSTSYFDLDKDVVIWSKRVENPEQYGVILVENDQVTAFVEKPNIFVSDLAIVGIYYFKNAEKLKEKIEHIIENNLKKSGEFQLTDALQILLDENSKFGFLPVDTWLDTGNPSLLLESSKYILKRFYCENSYNFNNSTIIQPVYIGKGVEIKNSIIGPNVSIEDNSLIDNCIISDSMIYSSSSVKNCLLQRSIVGNNCEITGTFSNLIIGDKNEIHL